MLPFRLVILLALALGSVHPIYAAGPLDWMVSGGQFYTQAAGDGIGFRVADDDGVPFLTELRRRGGPAGLGYPISRRFVWRGTTVQAFQKAVLQWLPGEDRVAFLNVFDDLSSAGHDEWLRVVRSTPGQTWLENEDKLSWDEVVKQRLAFLDASPAIKARYLSVKDPMTLYGLPSSRVEDMGNHYAVRLQRAVIQLWKVDVPWARAGETTVANGGDIAKEAGLFPIEALVPMLPDGTNASIAVPTPRTGPGLPPNTPPAPRQAPVAGPPPPSMPSPFKDPPLREIPGAGAAKRVVLDAGHGGGQIGSSATLSNGVRLYEKEVNLDIARRTATLLRQSGYDVVMTRDVDAQVGGPKLADDLQARIDAANGAKADVFVSIHHNGLGNRAVRGIEVYYATERPFTADSRALAELLYNQIGRQMYAAGYEAYPRGIKADTVAAGGEHFFLLSPQSSRVKRPSLMPAALVEALFLTNEQDAQQLERPAFREAIARGYAAAIATFLNGRRPWFS